jgi:hypothetical protein
MIFFKKPEDMSKQELGEALNYLQKKVDSGRHSGADVQRLREFTDVYIDRFEHEIRKEIRKKHLS